MRIEIDCINTKEVQGCCRVITNVGGPNPVGTRWRLPLSEAVAAAISGRWEFFVRQGSATLDVVPAQSPSGEWHLKLKGDSDAPDPLLGLHECPSGLWNCEGGCGKARGAD